MSSLRDKANLNSKNKKLQFCPYCGAKLIGDARFCTVCGEKITVDTQDDTSFSEGYSSQDDSRNEYSYRFNSQSGYTDNTDRQRNKKTRAESNKRETVYEGKLYKCPNCGEVLESFVTRCPSCGYEIRSTESTSSVEELSQKLERISARTIQGKYSRKRLLESEIEKDREKASLITSYSVPNTKEDILEFVILASSSIKYGDFSHNFQMDEVSKAWISKLEQVYQKATVILKGQPELQQIEQIYQDKMNEINRHKMLFPLIMAVVIGLNLFMLGFLFLEIEDNPILFIISILYFVVLAIIVVFLFRQHKYY